MEPDQSLAEAAYLRNDDILVELRGNKAAIDTHIRRIEGEQETIKARLLQAYTDDGVLPSSPLLHVRKVPPAIIVTDEAKIPDQFFKIEKKLNKTAINAAFKNGEQIDGVALGNGGLTLVIKA